jgi:hypothetical protein
MRSIDLIALGFVLVFGFSRALTVGMIWHTQAVVNGYLDRGVALHSHVPSRTPRGTFIVIITLPSRTTDHRANLNHAADSGSNHGTFRERAFIELGHGNDGIRGCHFLFALLVSFSAQVTICVGGAGSGSALQAMGLGLYPCNGKGQSEK